MVDSKEVITDGAQARDDLTQIKGISVKYAEALYQSGIYRYQDLASYKPAMVSKILLERADVSVSPKRIETAGWISQAETFAHKGNSHGTTTEGENSEKHVLVNDHDFAFTVIFDCDENEDQQEHWHTTVYDERCSGEEKEFDGTAIAQWANWILEQVKLPTSQEAPVAEEPDIRKTQVPEKAGIEILEVKVVELGFLVESQRKQLAAEIHFRTTGSTGRGPQERVRFWAQVHAVNTETGVSEMLVSKQGQVDAARSEHWVSQSFAVPERGHYELQTLVFLFPPACAAAFHRGIILNVVS